MDKITLTSFMARKPYNIKNFKGAVIMSIKKVLDSLELLYYEYDEKKQMFVFDENYSNRFANLEMLKITYQLSQAHIKFKVLKNHSIQLHEHSFQITTLFKDCLQSLKNRQQNIFVLNNQKVQYAQNLPLFEIKHLNCDIDLLQYEALVFTSKNAVEALESNHLKWKNIPAYAISEQTGKLIKDLSGYLVFTSKEKHGDQFALEIAPLLKNKKVLYVRGNKTVSNLTDILQQHHVMCEEQIVYTNEFKLFKTKKSLPQNSKIIFSSPSTIEYFLKNFIWDKSFTAIAIGHTTAKFFPKDITPVIADNTSLKACVKKALELS